MSSCGASSPYWVSPYGPESSSPARRKRLGSRSEFRSAFLSRAIRITELPRAARIAPEPTSGWLTFTHGIWLIAAEFFRSLSRRSEMGSLCGSNRCGEALDACQGGRALDPVLQFHPCQTSYYLKVTMFAPAILASTTSFEAIYDGPNCLSFGSIRF